MESNVIIYFETRRVSINSRYSVIPSPVLADTLKTSIPGRTGLRVSSRRCLVKFYGGSKIRFNKDSNVRAVEYHQILQGLVLALRYREPREAQIFAEIVRGRAHEIPYIFNPI